MQNLRGWPLFLSYYAPVSVINQRTGHFTGAGSQMDANSQLLSIAYLRCTGTFSGVNGKSGKTTIINRRRNSERRP